MKNLLSYIAVMALVTYLVRMVPLVLFRKKVENRFLRSFLYYIPYAVLSAMTFPAIFSSTADFKSALAGTLVALILAFFEKGLLPVALSACGAALLVTFL